jgi:DNA mismatch endonuclease (patch repair protein)
MAKVRQKNTDVEIALRKELYRRGLRYRVEFVILKKPRRIADVAFPGLKIAIFVDGCFWHGCPIHGTWPKQNSEFWRQKIEMNRVRDSDTNARLQEAGWTALRFWQHDSPFDSACTIEQAVKEAKGAKVKPRLSLPEKPISQ